MKHQEILANIDKTLDQLIQNAEVVNKVEPDLITSFELEAFQKTQESLLAKLLYMDEKIQEKGKALITSKRKPSYNIQEKLHYFQRLNKRFAKTSLKPIIRKTRKRKSTTAV